MDPNQGIGSRQTEQDGFGPALTYPRNVELLRQGGLPDEVLYLESGLVKLQRTDRDGRETIVQLAFRGTWLGTAAAIARIPLPASALTCVRCRLVRIPVQVFRERLLQDAMLSRDIHEAHARDLCRQTQWIGQLSSLTSRERLRRVILHLIEGAEGHDANTGRRIPFPLRQWELARLIAVTPEHVNRLLKELRRDGVIRQEHGRLIVDDVRRLCPNDDSSSCTAART